MSTANVELDKSWDSSLGQSLGTIQIRVVVLKNKHGNDLESQAQSLPSDLGDDEPIPQFGKTPLDTYLERPSGGKHCAVFLVNGQRHDVWDNAYLVKDLNYKYLRNRTMLIVDLDGLAPEALARLVQGSRQGFFRGEVFDAIRDRIYSTLKGDPDLKRLQAEAEQELAELESGDEAVKGKLDQLIENHHIAGINATAGTNEGGNQASDESKSFGSDKQQPVVIGGDSTLGTKAELPVLAGPAAIRLHPDEPRAVSISVRTPDLWSHVEAIDARTSPSIPELDVKVARDPQHAKVHLCYRAPDDMDDDDYPVVTSLRVYATFKNCKEPRLLERNVVVTKRSEPRLRKPEEPLLDCPTYLRVTSRQPIKLTLGGPSTHVRLRWDGKDHLVLGDPAEWRFDSRCVNVEYASPFSFSKPRDGRFELLIDAPSGLSLGQELHFVVQATGPNSNNLAVEFAGIVCALPEPIEPRKVPDVAPEPRSQRRPPYDLKYVKESQWQHGNCWGGAIWTGDDVACFQEPTETTPLTLLINSDAQLLTDFRKEMIGRKLVEATIQDRVTRYTAHVAFHLYQMFEYQRQRRENNSEGDDAREPTDAELRAEINRVAATLVRLMQVSQ